jgi:hypothetical protein
MRLVSDRFLSKNSGLLILELGINKPYGAVGRIVMLEYFSNRADAVRLLLFQHKPCLFQEQGYALPPEVGVLAFKL